MEKIKEPQQSVKHGSPKPSALHKKRADELCLNIHASRGSQRKGSRGEFLRFSEGLKLKQNAQHGTKWKPSHGRRARLHGSDEEEETTRQTKKIKSPSLETFPSGSISKPPTAFIAVAGTVGALGPISPEIGPKGERGSRAPRRLQTCLNVEGTAE